jgi:tetratricopeptide (TPR) repeat protein
MASSARIEELEKKFNENPRRYFAPLANEYRKAGDLTQAISICRTYVPQQPGHMSGHIVFGQALFEAGELDEARGVFESALLLDPENLIALRHLGDIARARGEIGSARSWYRRVLDADPRNDDMAAQLSGLDGVADAPAAAASAPVTSVDNSILDGLGSWHEINPERTLELPGSLAESAQRITEGTASWLETEPDRPAPATPASPAHVESFDAVAEASTDIAGFYGDGYTAAMADTPVEDTDTPSAHDAPVDAAPPADQGLGLEVMEFVPPARRQRESDLVAPADSADTPAAFVTETMAELYLQQGFRDEALEVYRQLLAQQPDDDTLRERVAQLESGSRSSFSAAGGVSDSVIEAATQRRNAPTVRSIRAFFGDLASRRVVTRYAETQYADRMEAAAAEAEAPDTETPMAAAPDTAVDVAVAHEDGPAATPDAVEHEAAEFKAPEASPTVEPTLAAAPPSAPEATVQPTVAEATMAETTVAETVVAETTVSETRAPEPTAPEPPRAPRPPELPTGGFGIRSGLYDRSYTEDNFGSPDLGTGAVGETALAEPEYGGESLISRRKEDVDQFGLPASGDAESFSFDQSEQTASAAQAAPPTGSVNGLFPDAHVTSSDEAAAETLSTAFGGPTAPDASGPGVRRASTELSLDSVFRESPPPPSTAPARREAGAFSFDQFFGYDPFANGESAGGSKDGAKDGSKDTSKDALSDVPAEPAGPAAASGATEPAETEQFSSWLSGLKKK